MTTVYDSPRVALKFHCHAQAENVHEAWDSFEYSASCVESLDALNALRPLLKDIDAIRAWEAIWNDVQQHPITAREFYAFVKASPSKPQEAKK